MIYKHIPSLNGLRALSILLVIFSHLYNHHYFNDGDILIKYVPLWLFNGALGVNIFFIISGFLITTLLKHELEAYGKISLKAFYMRRIIRIFPAYYFLLLVYFILQYFEVVYFDSENWLSSLTYTKQFFPSGDNESAHLWSLSSEEIFYLVWPLAFIMIKKKSKFPALGINRFSYCCKNVPISISSTFTNKHTF